MEASIYSGPRSCYARFEGLYVASGPMDFGKAAAHMYLHIRDLERGWTYDHACRRIRMTRRLFERRTMYLVDLCRKTGDDKCRLVEDLANYVIGTGILPSCLMGLISRKLVRVRSLM